jgi:hypothetical protein
MVSVTDLEAARAARDAKRAEEGMPEIAAEIREGRVHDLDAPITLAEVARVALERYRIARRAAYDLWRERLKAAGDERRKAVYSAADPSRPWDVSDRGDPTVTEDTKGALEEGMLYLLANDPVQAAHHLRYTAGLIDKAVQRSADKQARAERAERIARKHERERENIEREERRLARERERARKRLGLGVRGVAS